MDISIFDYPFYFKSKQVLDHARILEKWFLIIVRDQKVALLYKANLGTEAQRVVLNKSCFVSLDVQGVTHQSLVVEHFVNHLLGVIKKSIIGDDLMRNSLGALVHCFCVAATWDYIVLKLPVLLFKSKVFEAGLLHFSRCQKISKQYRS